MKKIMPFFKNFNFDASKNIYYYDSNEPQIHCELQLPFLIFFTLNKIFTDTNDSFVNDLAFPNYLIMIIKAGYAALAICQNGIIIKHKNIKKYMVRKKQGKAQLTYSSLKGKARGGAKLRLYQSKVFLIEISQKLNEWKKEVDNVNFIFFHSSPKIWSNVFKTTPTPPFSKSDTRLQKIPLTTYRPSYNEIIRVNSKLLRGYIKVKSEKEINNLDSVTSILLEKSV